MGTSSVTYSVALSGDSIRNTMRGSDGPEQVHVILCLQH